MLIAVNFHYIRSSFDSPHPSIHGITPAEFEGQLKTLGRIGEFVRAEQIHAALKGDGDLPERSILITFDDGLREQFDQALPVLLRLGIPALFFINTAPIAEGKVASVHKFHMLRANISPEELKARLLRHAHALGIELNHEFESSEAAAQYRYDTADVANLKYLLNFALRSADRDRLADACFNEMFDGREPEIKSELYMDRRQVRELGLLGYLGSHGHEHRPLSTLPAGLAEQQIRLSLRYLEEWSGQRPFAMSYPYGSRAACSPQLAEVAASAGVEFAFTVEEAGNVSLSHPLLLARFDTNDVPGGKASRFAPDELFETAPSASWFR